MVSVAADGPAQDFHPTAGGTVNQTVTIFTPANAHGGLLMVLDSGNYVSSVAATTIDDTSTDTSAMALGAYQRGWIVVLTGNTGWNSATDPYNGLWRDWDDATYINDLTGSWNERDAVWARQYCQSLDDAGSFSVPINHWSWYGVSQGAINGSFMSLGPDRALPGAAEAVRRLSTTFQSQFIMDPGGAWWTAHEQTIVGTHWPTGGVGTVSAPTIAVADQQELRDSSMIGFMNERVAAEPTSSFPPIYIGADEPHGATNFDLDVNGNPTVFDTFPLVPIHPAWGAQMLAKRWIARHGQAAFDARCRFVLLDNIAAEINAVAPGDDESQHDLQPSNLYSGTLSDRWAWLERQRLGQSNNFATTPTPTITASSTGRLVRPSGALPANS